MLKDEFDLRDENDVIFLIGCIQEKLEFFINYIVFEGDFYTYLSDFVGRDIK